MHKKAEEIETWNQTLYAKLIFAEIHLQTSYILKEAINSIRWDVAVLLVCILLQH